MSEIHAELAGSIWKITSAVGDHVDEDDQLMVMESMKMEIPVLAPRSGVVASVAVVEGQSVEEGQLLLTLA